jgi:dihydrofolate reductase
MIISMIVAMSENNVIGNQNKLPWHLPADLRYFKKITLGKPIIMGRKTFATIGRPLPGRQNIIVSRDENFKVESCEVVHTIAAALQSAEPASEVFIIGGGELYKQTLSSVDNLYVTLVHDTIDGDTFFPFIDPLIWHEVSRIKQMRDEKNNFDYSFILYKKNSIYSAYFL